MRRSPILAALVLAIALSCSSGPKVIPRRDMRRIYEEMFLRDKWLSINKMYGAADTTLVYDPIFGKYGYTYEDYYHTVLKYLDAPDKFDKLAGRIHNDIEKKKKAIVARNAELLNEEHRIEEMKAPESGFPRYYGKDFSGVRTDTLVFEKDTLKGVDFLSPVPWPPVRSFDTVAVSKSKEWDFFPVDVPAPEMLREKLKEMEKDR